MAREGKQTDDEATEEDSVWVRIKPLNLKRGYRARTYSAFGFRFYEGRGWYKINRVMLWGDGSARKKMNVGEYLKGILNNPQDDQSPPVFDVCTQAEADAINEAEKKRAAKAAEPSNPIVDLTSDDVRAGSSRDNKDDEDLAPPAAPAKRKSGRPAGSKNAPKAEPTE